MKKRIKIGGIYIGGGERVAIQSMTNTPTADHDATKKQIDELISAGCEIVRLAVSNMREVEICKKYYIGAFRVPLVADIQYDYKLAVACSDIGFDKIRFNPGNIGNTDRVKELVSVCKSNSTPIRIGVNSGSLEKDLVERYGNTAEAMVESALNHVKILEQQGFEDIVLSVKSSSVKKTVEAYRMLNQLCDYPLHIGVTESGYGNYGLVKSAIGLGALLLDGIGDTIRVSLSGNPVGEVVAAKNILASLGIRNDTPEIISCPTCSRCKYPLESVVKEIDDFCRHINKFMKLAVMGCAVNGIGEAGDADFGVAGCGDGKLALFVKGQIEGQYPADIAVEKLKKLIEEKSFE